MKVGLGMQLSNQSDTSAQPNHAGVPSYTHLRGPMFGQPRRIEKLRCHKSKHRNARRNLSIVTRSVGHSYDDEFRSKEVFYARIAKGPVISHHSLVGLRANVHSQIRESLAKIAWLPTSSLEPSVQSARARDVTWLAMG